MVAAISKTTFSGTFSEWKFYSLIQIPLLFVPNGPIHNKAALVHAMALRRTGDKPFPETMLTQLAGAYMQHRGRWAKLGSLILATGGMAISEYIFHEHSHLVLACATFQWYLDIKCHNLLKFWYIKPLETMYTLKKTMLPVSPMSKSTRFWCIYFCCPFHVT